MITKVVYSLASVLMAGFSLDWSISEASHRNQPGQSRVTLNLTSAAPVLIGCPDHHANSAASTEKVILTFNGPTDNVSNIFSQK